MSDALPEKWVWAEMQDICSKVQDGTHFSPQDQSSTGDYKYITAKNIKSWGLDLTNVTYVCENVHRPIYERCNPEKGDVLYIKDGATTGIATVNTLDEEFSLLSSVALFKPMRGVLEPHYLKWYLNSPVGFKAMTDQMTGSAITRLVLRTLRKSKIPIAPLAEQRRIVAKLESMLSKVDASQRRLAKIAALLKRFRQSILAAASSGRLTGDWRNENPKSPEWKTVELVELAENIQIGPFGTQLHKADYISNGVPLINPTHIQSSKIVHDPDFSVSQSKLKELGNYLLQTNDIIMGRRGEMARCAMISKKENGWLCGTGSLFIRPKSTVSPDFLFLVLRSPETKAFLESEAQGTTMSNLNLEILRRVPVFISSLAEQKEIVRRVEGLFALADQLELRLKMAVSRVCGITPSLLARAFAGKLVPQDPNDEPASELLARIRGEKTNQTQKGASGIYQASQRRRRKNLAGADISTLV